MAITRRGIVAAGAGMMLGGLAGGADAQTRWQAATPWAGGNLHSRNLRQFFAEVRQATDGGLDVWLHDAGTLLKATEILRGMQTGQVQVGDMLLSDAAALDPIMEMDALPMLVRGMEEARRLCALTRPFIEQRLQREGVTVLYLAPWPPSGLFSSFRVDSLSDLRGTRMRTMTPTAARLASLVGALSARVEPEELPQAFATRLASSMFASATTGVDVEAWTFTHFFMPLDMTYPKDAVCVQTRAWEALPDGRQKAVRDAAVAAEARAWTWAEADRPLMRQILIDRGMVIHPPSAALVAELGQVGQTMLEEWRARAGAPGARLLEALRAG